MSSPPEGKLETKAGHPPAVKAGGMRIVQKHPHSGDTKEEKDKDDQEWESPSPPKPTVFISGVIARVRALSSFQGFSAQSPDSSCPYSTPLIHPGARGGVALNCPPVHRTCFCGQGQTGWWPGRAQSTCLPLLHPLLSSFSLDLTSVSSLSTGQRVSGGSVS
uniref:Death associated protein n=1 Tax=Bos indicus x Bos taurus TaxID=30522 RepID=A0A4W2IS72_BOBOX